MNTSYVRLPADSTGKKIRHLNRIDLKMATLSVNPNTFKKGDVVEGQTSNTTASLLGWSTDLNFTFLHVIDADGSFTDGETVTVDSVSAGTISNSTDVYTPVVNIADPDNANYRQKIDKKGSSYVRHTDGDMLFDAFGNAQFSQTSLIDSHTFIYGDRPEKYYIITGSSGGSQTAQVSESCILFSTNATSGSISSRMTNQYYPYTPGTGTELIVSLMIGDTGKTGVVRRWGMYDDEDGVYFELSGSVFSANIKNSSTGTVSVTKVLQHDFNGDSLNESATSEYILDVSKYNIYYIDFQWLGAGRVRFGTYAPNGKRVILHTFENPNSHTVPYMRRGTLPFKCEQFNLTGVASTSEMKLLCSAIHRQSTDGGYSGTQYTALSNRITLSGSTYTPLLSIKPLATINGETNRTVGFLLDYETDVSGSGIILTAFVQPTLSGSTWSATTGSYSTTMVDIDSVSFTGGVQRASVLMPNGTFRREIRETLDNVFGIYGNGAAPTVTFAAKSTDSTIVSKATFLLRWKEVR